STGFGQSFLVTVPAGFFRRNPRGAFVFAGMIRGILLAATVTPHDGNSSAFQITGTSASNLPGVANPIDVRLAIRRQRRKRFVEHRIHSLPAARPMTSLRDDAPQPSGAHPPWSTGRSQWA